MSETIEQICQKKGVKLTDQRRIIAKVLSESKEVYGESDHPDVDELYKRVSKLDSRISIATIYRTVKLFEESGILTKHDFKGGKARYETIVDEEIEKLQKKVAEKYGYKLVDHKLELYGIKKLDEK
jgi:Fur family ferric uptake transcriptional regulator